jgi:very-short-patch-repair endonuclease
MDQCRETIPVWIMPRYLVAEMSIPAPNRYDVVIVDEASQLGIESLFLFYIAKKIIVVGDDQQISPYGVGIADQAIADLQHHYLDGIPHLHAFSAQSSLYANAKILFGQNVVLREHFRCMPEIIQFSNDLCYAPNGTSLDPLRAYPPNRLSPLVLRHVADGYRTGSAENAVNEPEADAIVAQIVACVGDARYAGCTMGVISLQGEAQAKLIEHKILEELEPEIIEARRLICGDAYAFQGDERNIIFLSMVAAPNERIGALANESARQRFNVAASRAQDQLWLFHSATLDVLSPVCMRHKLLSYMLSPARQATQNGVTRFDSKFEEDVFRLLRDRGFCVRTQVCVGDPTNHRYRIDLVVEGMQGRLAVECDGDQWHGPERYELDMARQRDLERAGWQFVRVRGGDFYRDQAKAMEPLWLELDRLGIKPGGIDESATEPPQPVARQPQESRQIVEEFAPVERMNTKTQEKSEPNLEPEIDDQAGAKPGVSIDESTIPGGRSRFVATEKSSESRSAGNSHDKSQHSTPEPNPQMHASANSLLRKYQAYQGIAGPDPRTVNKNTVADGLCSIIEVEGPMLAKRAYDIYLRGCGIQRLGGELKSTINKALMDAIRQCRIVSENEPNERGLLFSTVRIKATHPIKPRRRGSRTFEEIPPGELRYVGQHVLKIRDLEPLSDEHLRAILEVFDLKRLTTQVGTTLLEILERQDDRVNSLV